MSTLTTFDPGRVQRAVDAGSTRKQPFRDVRTWAMREYGGAWYGGLPSLDNRPHTDKRPINLIAQYVEAFLTSIVGESIQFDVKPRRAGLRGEAKVRELMLNHRAAEVGLLQTYRQVVLDTLFGGLGIFVVGCGESGDEIRFRGEAFDPGEFYAGRVDLDDYSSDPVSRDFREDNFRAHRFRTTKETLHRMYPALGDEIEALQTTTTGSIDHQGNSHEVMGVENSGIDRIYDEVELWEITIYNGKKGYRGIIPSLTAGGDWLLEPEEYMGLEGGPYVLMAFQDMPNNNHPLAPVAKIIDLHIAMARTGVKAVNQILRAGKAIFYTPAEEDAVAQLQDGPDDDFIKCQSPEKIQTKEYGGISDGVAKGHEWLKTEANNATSNIQQARGVSGDAGTATEASYLQMAMTRIQAHFRGRAREGLAQIGKHMAWDLDTNLMLKQTFNVRVPGVPGGGLDVMYDSATLEGNFTEFSWDVCPYDEPKGDRNMELARFNQMAQTLPAALTGIAQTGGDPRAFLRIAAQKYNEPALDEIYPDEGTMAAGQFAQMQGNPGQIVGQKQPRGRGGMTQGGRPQRQIDQVRSDMQG